MKKSVSKILAVMMSVILLVCAFASCAKDGENKDVLKIGVIQFMEHNALDAAYKGFVDELEQKGYSEKKGNLKINYNNAQGEQANCVTIADQLASSDCDLILAIATPAAQAVANKIKDIPILVTAITDAAFSGLVTSNENPGGNVSGTSDLNPISDQIDLLEKLAPGVKNVGLFYCSSEDNSKFQVDVAAKEMKSRGISTQEFTVTSQNEIQSVVESMAGKVDAIYIGTDNMLASGMATVSDAATKLKLPVIVGESGMVENGGLATYGINYTNLGAQTANMAIDILVNGKEISTMAIQYQDKEKSELAVNTKTAQAIGVTIPEDILSKAAVYPESAK